MTDRIDSPPSRCGLFFVSRGPKPAGGVFMLEDAHKQLITNGVYGRD